MASKWTCLVGTMSNSQILGLEQAEGEIVTEIWLPNTFILIDNILELYQWLLVEFFRLLPNIIVLFLNGKRGQFYVTFVSSSGGLWWVEGEAAGLLGSLNFCWTRVLALQFHLLRESRYVLQVDCRLSAESLATHCTLSELERLLRSILDVRRIEYILIDFHKYNLLEVLLCLRPITNRIYGISNGFWAYRELLVGLLAAWVHFSSCSLMIEEDFPLESRIDRLCPLVYRWGSYFEFSWLNDFCLSHFDIFNTNFFLANWTPIERIYTISLVKLVNLFCFVQRWQLLFPTLSGPTCI